MYKFRHYKLFSFWLFGATLAIFIHDYLAGLYIGNIQILGKLVPLVVFAVISSSFGAVFRRTVGGVLRSATRKDLLYAAILQGPLRVILSSAFVTAAEEMLSFTEQVLFIYILVMKNIITLLLSLVAAFLLILPALSFGLLLSSLLIYFRGKDVNVINHYVLFLTQYLIPSYFTYIAFSLYSIVKYIPPIGLIEEIRKSLFAGRIDLIVFGINIIESLIIFIIGALVFRWVLNKARKEGWIGLD